MILNDGKIRLALYVARNGNWFDKAINFGSGRLGYSHMEIVGPTGLSFSSTTREGGVRINNSGSPIGFKEDGTRWKEIDFDSDHWMFHDLPHTNNWPEMAAHADSILDARYDWWGAARVSSFGGFWFRPHADKYFCSEAVMEVCHAGGFFNSVASLISPNRFSLKLQLYRIT
jgi:hypothetical protein